MIYTLSIHLYPYAYPHLHHIYSIVSYRYWYSVVYIYLVSSRPSPSNHAYIHALIALSINASMPFHSPCSSTQPSIQGCIWCKMRMSRSISDPIYSIQQCIRLIVKLTVPEKKKISRNQGETFFSVSFSLPSAWSFRPGTPRGEKKKRKTENVTCIDTPSANHMRPPLPSIFLFCLICQMNSFVRESRYISVTMGWFYVSRTGNKPVSNRSLDSI